MSVLNAKHFHNEQAAYDFIEGHLWANGRNCPHCGTVGNSAKLKGKTTRIGVYKCYDCRKPFTVKVGTIFESSHIKMPIWLQAIFLISSSKKGISSNQLSRVLEITLKSAWFLSHRIREAMRDGAFAPLGGCGNIVEIDETYYGRTEKKATETTTGRKFVRSGNHGPSNKRAIVSLVERGGSVRSFHVDRADKQNVSQIVVNNIKQETRLFTDESRLYRGADAHVTKHETVRHAAKEYARGDVHTNTIEGYFSIFKRGMKGVYQHCGEKHLHRYLAEFDFRYNNRVGLGIDDKSRAVNALKGVSGKRLMYKTVGKNEQATA